MSDIDELQIGDRTWTFRDATAHEALVDKADKGLVYSKAEADAKFATKSEAQSGDFLPLAGGAMTGPIKYNSGTRNRDIIKFIPGTADGSGVRIGDGGATLIGGGESASYAESLLSSGNNERLILSNDGAIDLYTNAQNGIDGATHVVIGADGSYSIDGTTLVANGGIYGEFKGNVEGCVATKNNANSYPYHRILTCAAQTGDWIDIGGVYTISGHYSGGGFGIFKLYLRTNQASAGSAGACSVAWLYRTGFDADQIVCACRNTAKNTYLDVYYKAGGTYSSAIVQRLTSGNRNAAGPGMSFVNSSETASGHTECYSSITTSTTSPRTYTNVFAASDVGVVYGSHIADNVTWGNAAAADVSTLVNKLTTGTSAPVDADYYVAQYAGGGTTTTSYHRRSHSALWSYIKGKADSVYQPKGSYLTSHQSISHKMGVVTANNYPGMADGAGGTSNWIRTTSSGLIPYSSNSAGVSQLGTSTWPFKISYIQGLARSSTTYVENNGQGTYLRCISDWIRSQNQHYFDSTLKIAGSSIQTGSSAKIKRDVESITSEEAAKLMQVRPVSFRFKEMAQFDQGRHVGVIAEELAQVYPDLVDMGNDDSDEPSEVASVRYTELIPHLIKLCQDQQKRIESLEKQVNDLSALIY